VKLVSRSSRARSFNYLYSGTPRKMSSAVTVIDELLKELDSKSVSAETSCKEIVFESKFRQKHVRIKTLLNNHSSYLGKSVLLCGWVSTSRQRFIQLNDGSNVTDLQLVVDLDNPTTKALVKQITVATSVQVTGKVISSKGREQAVEIQVESIKILGGAMKEYPFQKGQTYNMEFLREFQHLRVRTIVIRAAQTIRNQACKATHDFFQQRNFQYVHTPLLTAADCEGAGEAFTVTNLLTEKTKLGDLPVSNGEVDFSKDFFGKQTNLTVSGQLHVETFCHGLGNVYTFGPTFRAENSQTSRHLAEFWMIEPEIAFCDFKDVQDLAEDYLKYCLKSFITNCPDELQFLGKRYDRADNVKFLNNICEKDFARVSYTEGVRKLIEQIEQKNVLIVMSPHKFDETLEEVNKSEHVKTEVAKKLEKWKTEGKVVLYKDKIQIEGFKVIGPKKARKKFSGKTVFENAVYWGVDLSSEHEKFLTKCITKVPTILCDYPTAIKAFYMKANTDGKTCQACDVLVPGVGEVIGGSQREDDLTKLTQRVKDIGIDPKDMSWYLDLRRYGSIPHGGFGLGLERLLMLATGIDNIRDLIPYPRYPGKCAY